MSVLLLLFSADITPACHLERSPPEIPSSLCSVLPRSSTSQPRCGFASFRMTRADAVETQRVAKRRKRNE